MAHPAPANDVMAHSVLHAQTLHTQRLLSRFSTRSSKLFNRLSSAMSSPMTSLRITSGSVTSLRHLLRFSLAPLRHRLDTIEIRDPGIAHAICRFIPGHCPFERDLSLLGRTVHVPPMCKLNPLFEEVMALRFRALSYLADQCGEDITPYLT